MKLNIFLIFAVLNLVFISCEKNESNNGTSSITGKIFVKDYSADFKILKNSYYMQEVPVYILNDNESVYFNRFVTSYDGSFRFDKLRKGKYKIFVYSRDSTFKAPSGNVPVFVDVEIKNNFEHILLDDIEILK